MTDDESDLLADLLVKWEESHDGGIDLSAEELCIDSPNLTAELAARIESLKSTAWTKKDPARPLTDHRDVDLKDFSGGVLASRYRLDELLGRGGYGQVYRAHDLQLHRNVAVKIGHARTSSDLLLDEARRVARLKYPSIVGVHDCGEHDGRVFLVFELVEGRSLAALIRERKLLVRESVELVAEVADALDYAHKQGCIHRDIKPENILIDGDGKPLVADFGVACTLEEIQKGRSVSSGTLAYMAPEQIAQETQLLDGRCDIHALGVLLFELLTSKSPFPAGTPADLREQILFRQPIMLRAADPSLPVALEAICAKAMAKHPADRFESADEMASELRGWLDESKAKRSWTTWVVILLIVPTAIGTVISWAMLKTSFVQEGAIFFDGRMRISTPVKRTLPVTLEAWVRPDPYTGSHCQFIIGSDVPTKYGIGIGVCGSVLSAEYMSGMINSTAAVPPSMWSHVAGVFTEDETRLYLNGKLVHSGPGGSVREANAAFSIGNVGVANSIDFFHGLVRVARISEGERYKGDFTPPDDLGADAASIAIYSPEGVSGRVVRDLSGRANDASIETMTERR